MPPSQVHAATIALLLAGPVQIIHASPLAHVRAMRAVRNGLAGRVGALARAGPLARSVRFVFAPTDHHDHWHVNFQAHGDNVPHPERIGDLLPLWSALGIDLVPLARALRDLVLQPRWPQVEQERATLVGFLEDYVPQPDGLKRLHDVYAAANTMLTPMGGAEPSKELKQAIADTDAVLSLKRAEVQAVDPDRGE